MKSAYKKSKHLLQPRENSVNSLIPERYCPEQCGWIEAALTGGIEVTYTPYWDDELDDEGITFIKKTVIHEFGIGSIRIICCPGCGADLTRATKGETFLG